MTFLAFGSRGSTGVQIDGSRVYLGTVAQASGVRPVDAGLTSFPSVLRRRRDRDLAQHVT